FEIANYDRSKPLVIDPTIAFSTFLGGSGNDRGDGIAIDSAGNAYITGNTNSANFPITPGVFQPAKASLDFDVFVTKMNSTGTASSTRHTLAAVTGNQGTTSLWTQQATHT